MPIQKRTAVEECVARLSAIGLSSLIDFGAGGRGWTDEGTDLHVLRVDGDRAKVHVAYRLQGREGVGLHRDVDLDAVRVPSAVGGRRWLLTCPSCETAARELYVPPGRVAFTCRGCAALSYSSRQTRGVRLWEVLSQEEAVLERLRRARSPERIRRLRARAARLKERRRKAMTKPLFELLGVLDRVVG